MCYTIDNMHVIKTVYENIYGQILKLKIFKHSNVTEVVVMRGTEENFHAQCLLLLCILVTNLLAFIFDIVRANYFLALISVTAIFAYRIFSAVKYETLLLVKNIGCQVTVKYALGHTTKFIPFETIAGIFINEVFSKHRVLFVLTILVREDDKESVIPVFTGTKPRLICLQAIYQNLVT